MDGWLSLCVCVCVTVFPLVLLIFTFPLHPLLAYHFALTVEKLWLFRTELTGDIGFLCSTVDKPDILEIRYHCLYDETITCNESCCYSHHAFFDAKTGVMETPLTCEEYEIECVGTDQCFDFNAGPGGP